MANREPTHALLELVEGVEARDFAELIAVPIGDEPGHAAAPTGGIVVGTLVGLTENGAIPLVTFPGQTGSAPIAARTTMDLYAPHVGRDVVVMFEAGDRSRPIITGCIRRVGDRSVPELPGQVELEADGERLMVSAVHGL